MSDQRCRRLRKNGNVVSVFASDNKVEAGIRSALNVPRQIGSPETDHITALPAVNITEPDDDEATVFPISGSRVMAPSPPKVGLDRSKVGRKKGTPNKTTALLKDAILKAAEKAGGKGGLVSYLRVQANENPGPFMALLGKVLPMQIAGHDGGELKATISIIELVAEPIPAEMLDPPAPDADDE